MRVDGLSFAELTSSDRGSWDDVSVDGLTFESCGLRSGRGGGVRPKGLKLGEKKGVEMKEGRKGGGGGQEGGLVGKGRLVRDELLERDEEDWTKFELRSVERSC